MVENSHCTPHLTPDGRDEGDISTYLNAINCTIMYTLTDYKLHEYDSKWSYA